MKKICKKCIALLLALSGLFVFSGCYSTRIQEDGVKEALPAIDPEAGVARDESVTLYYRLANEACLVGVTRNISVRANERNTYAIIRTLLEGVPPLSNNVEALFPAGTSIVDVSLEGSILYVTLSKEFMDTSVYDETVRELTTLLERGELYMTQAVYEKRMREAEEELYLKRALAVYSVVNTLCGYSPDLRVHFLVDVDGSGNGVRLKTSELGLASGQNVDSNLIEPMAFEGCVVASPLTILDSLLNHLLYDEYEMAYALFAENENSEQQKPGYANFETEILSIGHLRGYAINSYYISSDEAVIAADGTVTQ
ncbi:MAG: GerMN domain-containing protein [Firmicutes bacterium]|nr:GerMN domain-containing protein [Bacillota bacterium]